MKKLIYHIIRFTLGILLVVLTVASATAQTKPVIGIEVPACEVMEFSVVQMGADRYVWDIYKENLETTNFAQTDGDVDQAVYFENGMDEGHTVKVNWLEPGQYMVKVTAYDEVSCSNNIGLYLVNVVEEKPEASIIGDSLCIDEQAIVKIIFTGTGPWDITYTYGDGTVFVNLNGIVDQEYTMLPEDLPPLNESTEIWVMEVVEYNGICKIVNSTESERARVVIYPKPTNSKIYLKE